MSLPIEPNGATCTACRAPFVEQDQLFCGRCGYTRSERQPQAASPRPTKAPRRKIPSGKFALVIGAVLITALVGLVSFLGTSAGAQNHFAHVRDDLRSAAYDYYSYPGQNPFGPFMNARVALTSMVFDGADKAGLTGADAACANTLANAIDPHGKQMGSDGYPLPEYLGTAFTQCDLYYTESPQDVPTVTLEPSPTDDAAGPTIEPNTATSESPVVSFKAFVATVSNSYNQLAILAPELTDGSPMQITLESMRGVFQRDQTYLAAMTPAQCFEGLYRQFDDMNSKALAATESLIADLNTSASKSKIAKDSNDLADAVNGWMPFLRQNLVANNCGVTVNLAN